MFIATGYLRGHCNLSFVVIHLKDQNVFQMYNMSSQNIYLFSYLLIYFPSASNVRILIAESLLTGGGIRSVRERRG